MNDSRPSLLLRLWGVALSALGIAATLCWAVSLLKSIWPWLAGMAVVVLVVLVFRRWWEHGRW